MSRNCKCQAQIHPRRVSLDGSVEELSDTSEVDDEIKLSIDLSSRHSKNCCCEADVVPAAQLRMEPGADLQERADAAADAGLPFAWCGDPCQELEKCALSGSIPTYDADAFTGPDLE